MRDLPIILKQNYNNNGIAIEEIGINPIKLALELLQPHRHDHYSCFFIERGTLELLVDFQKTVIGENTLFISYPGQIHQFIKSTNATGWSLMINHELLDDHVSSVLQQSLSEVISLNLTADESTWFRTIFSLIAGTAGKKNEIAVQAQAALLTALIHQVVFAYQGRKQHFTFHHSANRINITKKFMLVLRQKFKLLKRPGDYAQELNLSVSYLNDTVKNVTGFPLTYFIQQEVIRETQRLLYYSDLSIKEIAVCLGYEDFKYFNRLFSKIVGISPGAFRKQKIQ